MTPNATGKLPGSELIEPGLRDLAAGERTEEALLVLLAASRLREAGVAVPNVPIDLSASHELYQRLSVRLGDGAHARHHAMVRRATSYAAAYAQSSGR